MGFDSTLVLAWASSVSADAEGFTSAYPEVSIEMPRWGWQWASDRHDLVLDRRHFRLYSGPEGGMVEDSYGQPIRALDPRLLLDYVDREHRSSRTLPSVVALRSVLRSLLRRPDPERVVLFLGH